MLTQNDLQQLEQKGISRQLIDYQIGMFKKGFPFIDLVRPATPGDGIQTFDDKQIGEFEETYKSRTRGKKLLKFVPASGAATRMFKSLFQFIKDYHKSEQEIASFMEDRSFNSVYHFISSIANFAFYEKLEKRLQEKSLDINTLLHEKEFDVIINNLLDPSGLNYGQQPKGLILFHNYEAGPRYAVEEHLAEGAAYCAQNNGQVHIHFTISPEHRDSFEQVVNEKKTTYEKEFGIEYFISFSEQKPSTDTIAVGMDNEPFRNADGSILFRPGGHGALIENLDDLLADIIFIKNIDNVVPDHYRDDTITYKKVLGGLLLKVQEKTFEFLKMIHEQPAPEMIPEISDFARESLNINLSKDFENEEVDRKLEILKSRLNRPLRVCGMVKNEGEPGGGPFWVRNQEGQTSLQIVEASQINPDDPGQQEILRSATHFNPVDLVCGVKNYLGEKFDLHQYIDPSTGFISVKSKDGRDLKAQELPGLWNGAMAGWNTIFVEVPISTFNPVKTVNDLLRVTHQ